MPKLKTPMCAKCGCVLKGTSHAIHSYKINGRRVQVGWHYGCLDDMSETVGSIMARDRDVIFGLHKIADRGANRVSGSIPKTKGGET